MEIIIALILIILAIYLAFLALIYLVTGVTYVYYIAMGVLPFVGACILCLAVIIGMVYAIRSLIKAMRETYGKEA